MERAAAAGSDQQHSATSTSALHLLATDVLHQVLSMLGPEDVARLSCTSCHLRSEIGTGRRALQLWLGHCKELLGDLPVAQVTAACRADKASTWQQLYASARMLDRLHWSPSVPAASALMVTNNSSRITATITPAAAAAGGGSQQQQRLLLPAAVADAASLLARTNHTATTAGTHLVLIGGDVRDGPAPTASDVVVLDLPGRRIIQPRLHSQQPPSLRHHCTVLLRPPQGSALFDQVADAIGAALKEDQQQQLQSASSRTAATATTSTAAAAAAPSGTLPSQQHLAATGHTLAVFGGLLPDGSEQPSARQQLHVLWLHPDASWGVWLQPATTGPAPAPRAFACCAALSGGSRLLVYGGWVHGSHTGTVQSDVGVFDGFLLLCIYLLDCASLAWSRVPTRPLSEPPRPGHAMIGPTTCPGPRKQALSCVRTNPATGREEFVVLGGCGADGLADFVPYSLNLQTFSWTKGPAIGYLPAARGLCSVVCLTPSWLLLLGGQGPTKEPLLLPADIQRLHLPTLSWRPPIPVSSSSSSSSSARAAVSQQPAGGGQEDAAACCPTVGCSTAAGVVLGGVLEGAYGSSIVPRLQMLLPGPLIPAVELPQSNSLAAAGAAAAGAPAGLCTVRSHGLAGRGLLHAATGHLQDAQQQQPAWHAYVTSGCRCGSCCGCLAAKAAASGGAAPCAACTTPNGCSSQQNGVQSASAARDYSKPTHGDVAALVRSSQGVMGPEAGSKPAALSAELEIQPAPGASSFAGPQKCVAASLGVSQQVYAGSWPPEGGPGGAAGSDRVWQTKEGGHDGWGLQMLLAVLVVFVGLVLMAPSFMMHHQ